MLYASVQGAFQYGITAPLRRRRRGDPDPPALEQHRPQLQRIEAGDHLEVEDAPQQAPRHQANDARLGRNQVRQRAPNRPRERRVETIIPAYSEDERDGVRREGGSEAEQDPSAESDSENQQEAQQEPVGESAANTTQAKTKPSQADSSQAKAKPLNVKKTQSPDEPNRDNAAVRPQPAENQPSQTTDVPVSALN